MKTKTTYICSECGYKSPKWLGKCPDRRHIVLVHGNRVFQAVRIDYVFVDDEGYAFNFDFLFLIGIFTFVEAHTELHVALSAAAHFGFSNAEHGVFVVFFHQQFLKLGDNFGCYRNFQHAFPAAA